MDVKDHKWLSPWPSCYSKSWVLRFTLWPVLITCPHPYNPQDGLWQCFTFKTMALIRFLGGTQEMIQIIIHRLGLWDGAWLLLWLQSDQFSLSLSLWRPLYTGTIVWRPSSSDSEQLSWIEIAILGGHSAVSSPSHNTPQHSTVDWWACEVLSSKGLLSEQN